MEIRSFHSEEINRDGRNFFQSLVGLVLRGLMNEKEMKGTKENWKDMMQNGRNEPSGE